MKYTENFFKFPIRVSKYEYKKEEGDDEPSLTSEWVRGIARLPLEEIVSWYDAFSEERDVKDVAENGFDITILETRSLGEFIVNMKREKFEDLLNKFAQKKDKNEEEIEGES